MLRKHAISLLADSPLADTGSSAEVVGKQSGRSGDFTILRAYERKGKELRPLSRVQIRTLNRHYERGTDAARTRYRRKSPTCYDAFAEGVATPSALGLLSVVTVHPGSGGTSLLLTWDST